MIVPFLKKNKKFIIIACVLFTVIVILLIIRKRKQFISDSSDSSSDNLNVGSYYIAEYFPLRKGMKGPKIQGMQDSLISAGFSCGVSAADGKFGNYTLLAVRKFFNDETLNEVTEGKYILIKNGKLTLTSD
jgi:hypothetical protein